MPIVGFALMTSLATACAPTGAEEGGGGSTDSTASTTTTDGSSTGALSSSETSDSAAAESSVTSTMDSSGAESEAGSTGACGCVFHQLAVNEPSPAGYSFEELAAALPGGDGSWTWTAVEGTPSTTFELTFEIGAGMASWREDPCGEQDDCRGLSGPVMVRISTADGLLDETLEGGIDGLLGETAALDVTADDLRGFEGTLSNAAFVDDNGDPIVVDSAGVGGRWTWEDRTPSGRFFVYTPVPQAEAIVLGESVE
jgi:hypothetical protein